MDLHYKGFQAKIMFASDLGLFHGEVSNCSDLIVFQAKTTAEAELAFFDAVEQYIQYLKQPSEEGT